MLHKLEKETVEARICNLIASQQWEEAKKMCSLVSAPNRVEIDYQRHTIKVFKTRMIYHNAFYSKSTRDLERVFYGFKSLYE
jgi:hypothetical protein